MDCMELMKQYPDKHFDLAVIDPPYGIGEDGLKNHSRGSNAKPTMYTPKNWDRNPANKEYFNELIRASKNQIIWGANHFIENIPNANSSGWIVWDKMDSENDFSSCELAYTSFKKGVKKFKFLWSGYWQGNMKNKETRIHPTQKPVALYDWILKNYAKEGDKIFDSHLGSGSSRIAAHKAKLDFVGCEIDAEYFEKQEKRFKQFISQLTIF